MATLAELELQGASFGQSRSVAALVRQKFSFREEAASVLMLELEPQHIV
jgi:hypothetical protein